MESHSLRTRWLVAGGLASTYSCSRLFTYTNGWAWNHDTAVLCMVGAFLLHVRGLRRDERWPVAAAGFLVGMAIGIRLSFALTFIPFALSLLLSRSKMSLGRRLAALTFAGSLALLASAPALLWAMKQPGPFYFGNFEYVRLNTAFYATTTDVVAMTWGGKLAYGFKVFFSDPGNALLLVGSVYLLGWRIWHSGAWKHEFANELGLILGLLPVLLVGCWGPTPTQYQYFYMMMPFMTLGILYCAGQANRQLDANYLNFAVLSHSASC